MRRMTRSAIVEHSADAFYALVNDIEAYPEFLPWCAAAAMSERGAARTVATMTLQVKGMRYSLTTENQHEPGRSIRMQLVEGPFRQFSAEWRFTPLGKEACKAEFSLAYEFSSRLLARALDPIFARMADSTVHAFVGRAAAKRDEIRR
jgi:ribosome-associated toxin RatA of RatAB toxin-antitoxin module